MTTDDTRTYAEMHDVQMTESGCGFVLLLDDETQIDTTEADQDGVAVGAGKLDGSGWVELNLTWQALQILADELNAQLRQARVNDWM